MDVEKPLMDIASTAECSHKVGLTADGESADPCCQRDVHRHPCHVVFIV